MGELQIGLLAKHVGRDLGRTKAAKDVEQAINAHMNGQNRYKFGYGHCDSCWQT